MRRALGALAPLVSIMVVAALIEDGRSRAQDHPRALRASDADLTWGRADAPSAVPPTEASPRQIEPASASWRVKVVDHDGDPLASIRVRVTYAAASFYDPRFREAVTGEDGGAVFDRESVPIERITAYGARGHAGATITSADLADGVVMRLQKAAPVEGAVVDETGRGVEHVLLKCSGVSEGYVPVTSAEGGAFTVWSSVQDRVKIELVGVWGPTDLDRYRYRASPVYAWAGTPDVVMRVSRVQKTDVIRVTVVLPDGLPAAGAMVRVYDIGREPCATDDTGTVVLEGLPCEPLRICAEPRVEGRELFRSVVTDVDGDRMVTLTLRASTAIEGTVVDRDNRSVGQAVVAVHDGAEVYLGNAVGGRFSVRVPGSGVWSVSACGGPSDGWFSGRGVVAGVAGGSSGIVVRIE